MDLFSFQSSQTERRSFETIIIQRPQKCEFDIWITKHEDISNENQIKTNLQKNLQPPAIQGHLATYPWMVYFY